MEAKIENMIEKLEKDKESIFLVLNENVSQILLAIRLLLGEAHHVEGSRMEIIDTCSQYIGSALDDLRNLSSMFWPYSLYHTRFSDTMRSLADEIMKERSISITWKMGQVNENISLTKKLIVCQILEEQLKNILYCPLVKNIAITFTVEYSYIILSIADHIDTLCSRPHSYDNRLRAVKEKIEIFKGRFSLTFQGDIGNLLIVQLP